MVFKKKDKSFKESNVTDEDFSLNVLLAIKSPVLVMLKDEYRYKHLDRIWNKERQLFLFFQNYSGDVLSSLLDDTSGTVNVKFNPKTLTPEILSNIMKDVHETVIEQQKEFIENEKQDDAFTFSDEHITRYSIQKFFDYLFQDSKFTAMVFFNHLEKSLLDNVWIERKELYSHRPLIEVGEEMQDEKTVTKALEKTKTEYAKYKDNPALSGKFERKIKDLEQEMKNYETFK